MHILRNKLLAQPQHRQVWNLTIQKLHMKKMIC